MGLLTKDLLTHLKWVQRCKRVNWTVAVYHEILTHDPQKSREAQKKEGFVKNYEQTLVAPVSYQI